MALFRREAMAGRGQALEGAVSLAVPLSWQIVGVLLFVAVAGAALFLILARTDRSVRLEAAIDEQGRALAILPADEAALVASDACGTLIFQGGLETRACVTGREGQKPLTLVDGTVVIGQSVRLRLSRPFPPGARGQVRFAAGRETLWSSLTR